MRNCGSPLTDSSWVVEIVANLPSSLDYCFLNKKYKLYRLSVLLILCSISAVLGAHYVQYIVSIFRDDFTGFKVWFLVESGELSVT